MTYELKAVRVSDDGVREDCILCLWNDLGNLAIARVLTMKGAIAYAHDKLKDHVASIAFELKSDWVGDPSIFFLTTLHSHAAQIDVLLESTELVEHELRPIAARFEPDRLVYFNYRGAGEVAKP